MRIDIDALPCRLLQKHFQITQVMAGNENARIVADAQFDFRYLRISVGGRVRLVQQCHAVHTVFTSLQDQRRQCIRIKRIIKCLGQGRLDESVNFSIVLHEGICMF